MQKILSRLVLCTLAAGITGCSTYNRGDAYAQSKTVTLEEWAEWAETISLSIINAGPFKEYRQVAAPNGRVTVAIGDFTNSSTRMDAGQDKDVFLNALTKKLTNSGQIQVTRLYGGTGGRTDSVTRNSRELAEDPQFRAGSTARLDGNAEAAQLVLSMQFNQKRSTKSGDVIYENYCHIELIDQVNKAAIYMDDVSLKPKIE
jgi:hypothetical protein